MIGVVKWVLGLVLAWSLYWAGAGWWMQKSVADWFALQAARGWQADYADLSLSGFPTRHVTTLDSPALADPAAGTAWQAERLGIDSRAIWPGHVTLRFADAPQRLSYFDQTLTLTTQDMAADLRLHPGLALELEHLSLQSSAWAMTQEAEPLASAEALVLSKTQTDEPAVYTIKMKADGFAPGDRLRRAADITETLPEAFETLELDATITWDKPWDRSALETARPQPRHVDLRLAEAQWGALRLLAAGEFTVDRDGLPDGTITIKAENWRDMLAIAVDSGALPPSAATTAERTLGFLEGLGGNPNALDLRLNLRAGAVALGPIPLGPAPRLILR